MKGYATLTARVRRLETQNRSRRPKPPIIFTVYPDQPCGGIIGLAGMAGATVDRGWSEPLADLARRARAALGGARVMIARYAPSVAPQPPLPTPVPPPPEPKPSDPYALAGIGREATRAELERMGYIDMPPERIA